MTNDKMIRIEQFPKVRATLRLVNKREKILFELAVEVQMLEMFTVLLKTAFKIMRRVKGKAPCIL